MSHLAYDRVGSGEPLVLLHALGLSRRTWDPVVPALSKHFEVIAVDLPGFGDSEPMPSDIEPTPANLAAAVGALLDDLGLSNPHLVGNSLGGWVTLELASTRPAASVTLLSPAGLWREATPLYCRVSLRATPVARPVRRRTPLSFGEPSAGTSLRPRPKPRAPVSPDA